MKKFIYKKSILGFLTALFVFIGVWQYKLVFAATKTNTNIIETTVTAHVDGDTVKAKINGKTEYIRLIGVNTPETVKPNSPVEYYGKEASDFTKKSLLGKKVYLTLDVQERDKYGRILAYLWTSKPNNVNDINEVKSKMFNAKLISEGYAQVMTIAPNVKYSKDFVSLEKTAREKGKGLWAKEKSKNIFSNILAKFSFICYNNNR